MLQGRTCALILLLAACERDVGRPADRVAPADAATTTTTAAPRPSVDRGARFDAAFGPQPPSGWRPAVGDEVLARFVDTSWYGATVLEVKPDKAKARLRWSAGDGRDRYVPLADIAPLRRGIETPTMALAPPQSATDRWLPVEVLVIEGETAEVSDRDGRRQRLPTSVLVALP